MMMMMIIIIIIIMPEYLCFLPLERFVTEKYRNFKTLPADLPHCCI
jgi:hypothetical protein